MSSETSAVNVHGAWSAKRLTLLAMMLIPYVSTLTGWEAEIKPVE